MEKTLKIYIYEEGEPPLFHYSKSLGILGIEGIIIHQIEISKFRTRDPNKAHLFLLPISVQSIATYAYVRHNRAWDPLQNIARDYIKLISTVHPYWNRTLGHDHFIIGCHDWVRLRFPSIPSILIFENCRIVRTSANSADSDGISRRSRPVQELNQSSLQRQHFRRIQTFNRRIDAGDLPPRRNDGGFDGRTAGGRALRSRLLRRGHPWLH